jgi:hypothetical protein
MSAGRDIAGKVQWSNPQASSHSFSHSISKHSIEERCQILVLVEGSVSNIPLFDR